MEKNNRYVKTPVWVAVILIAILTVGLPVAWIVLNGIEILPTTFDFVGGTATTGTINSMMGFYGGALFVLLAFAAIVAAGAKNKAISGATVLAVGIVGGVFFASWGLNTFGTIRANGGFSITNIENIFDIAPAAGGCAAVFFGFISFLISFCSEKRKGAAIVFAILSLIFDLAGVGIFVYDTLDKVLAIVADPASILTYDVDTAKYLAKVTWGVAEVVFCITLLAIACKKTNE